MNATSPPPPSPYAHTLAWYWPEVGENDVINGILVIYQIKKQCIDPYSLNSWDTSMCFYQMSSACKLQYQLYRFMLDLMFPKADRNIFFLKTNLWYLQDMGIFNIVFSGVFI